ncbi:DUF2795 domain-containing protein [Streptomyces sp. NBC_01803]|uniref:DUF2795 domain-containing protein n=1 Tax=Streptomyces sp. NBC_01803 TaxID=2975946 RepID=UPI002DD7EA65|nr:DUF2795 domain-containing protein [Streptomyces sp. NBC_01803]WSA43401.1 DUF2795 domain-containing protein [Streptomyces sp. NBC_01803]
MGKPNPIDVQKALKDINYPTDKKSVVKQAKKNGADKELVDKFSDLKKDRFDGPDDVEKAIFRS